MMVIKFQILSNLEEFKLEIKISLEKYDVFSHYQSVPSQRKCSEIWKEMKEAYFKLIPILSLLLEHDFLNLFYKDN